MNTGESALLAEILTTHSRGDVRLFRINAGHAWSGTIVHRTARIITLRDYHPVRLACEGFADLAGWSPRDGHAIFTAIEGKYGRNRPTAEQIAFLEQVRRAGGRAGVAYSLEQAAEIIRGP